MDTIDIVTENWTPGVHCSNCSQCIVFKTKLGDGPFARCKAGYGEAKSLVELLRKDGRAFRNARLCPNYDSMDDDKPLTTLARRKPGRPKKSQNLRPMQETDHQAS